jgi:hypothetical protein
MIPLHYTLISDGSSDQLLLKPLRWLLLHLGIQNPLQGQWADLRRLPSPPKELAHKIQMGLKLYPCDLLFVHRDAEKAPAGKRRSEITRAVQQVPGDKLPPMVCVIPVRMQEAWLLFDEAALRRAAGNPNGQEPIHLPRPPDAQRVPDPKSLLHEALKNASGLSGRRRKNFPVTARIHRLADLIASYEPLLQLSAFRALQNELRQTLQEHGWLPSAGKPPAQA